MMLDLTRANGMVSIQCYSYDSAGNVVSVNYDGEDYYYLRNAQNDVVEILDSAGASKVLYQYDGWGKLIKIQGSGAWTIGRENPFRYRGYYYDTETELYYLQSRYYDLEAGRFISTDGYVSTGQGLTGNNMFAYCGNNPINRLDSSGTGFLDLFQALKQALQQTAPMFATAGGVTQADSPLPGPADVIGLGIFVAGVFSTVAKTADIYGQNKAKAKVKEKEEEKAAVTKQKPKPTVIYRYYSSKTKNLAPRPGIDYDGLSFSIRPPRPGISAVITTVEQINATGMLLAIQKGDHVAVIPTNATVIQWMEQGQSSIWSQTLSNIVVEWEGGY